MMTLGTFLGLISVTGGATLLGSIPVLFHRYLTDKSWIWWEGFCGGVMISASIFSLFFPALEILIQEEAGIFIFFEALIVGVIFIMAMSRFIGKWTRSIFHQRAYLFVFVMALHNVPEGLAVGVDVAALGWTEALPLWVAIVIQNIPEGFVSSLRFLVAGFHLKEALLANALTALVEALAAIGGFHFVVSTQVGLPFMLTFAGACMMSVVINEIFHKFQEAEAAAFSSRGFAVGFLISSAVDFLL
jgi:zinc transporter, ZIP family